MGTIESEVVSIYALWTLISFAVFYTVRLLQFGAQSKRFIFIHGIADVFVMGNPPIMLMNFITDNQFMADLPAYFITLGIYVHMKRKIFKELQICTGASFPYLDLALILTMFYSLGFISSLF